VFLVEDEDVNLFVCVVGHGDEMFSEEGDRGVGAAGEATGFVARSSAIRCFLERGYTRCIPRNSGGEGVHISYGVGVVITAGWAGLGEHGCPGDCDTVLDDLVRHVNYVGCAVGFDRFDGGAVLHGIAFVVNHCTRCEPDAARGVEETVQEGPAPTENTC
jgi:hypothetical protein